VTADDTAQAAAGFLGGFFTPQHIPSLWFGLCALPEAGPVTLLLVLALGFMIMSAEGSEAPSQLG
jgi:hypothetical protein